MEPYWIISPVDTISSSAIKSNYIHVTYNTLLCYFQTMMICGILRTNSILFDLNLIITLDNSVLKYYDNYTIIEAVRSLGLYKHIPRKIESCSIDHSTSSKFESNVNHILFIYFGYYNLVWLIQLSSRGINHFWFEDFIYPAQLKHTSIANLNLWSITLNKSSFGNLIYRMNPVLYDELINFGWYVCNYDFSQT